MWNAKQYQAVKFHIWISKTIKEITNVGFQVNTKKGSPIVFKGHVKDRAKQESIKKPLK